MMVQEDAIREAIEAAFPLREEILMAIAEGCREGIVKAAEQGLLKNV